MHTQTNHTPILRSQIPRGVQDRLLLDAARRRRAKVCLRDCFVRWSYQKVIPPTLEYYDNLSVRASTELQRGITRTVRCMPGAWLLTENGQERSLTAEKLYKNASTWKETGS